MWWEKSVLGWEDPLEKGKATHSSILAWRIPWTVYSPWAHKESDMTEQISLSLSCRTGEQQIIFEQAVGTFLARRKKIKGWVTQVSLHLPLCA